MMRRFIMVGFALALPVLVAVWVVKQGLTIALVAENSTVIQAPRLIPDSLEEARAMAAKRLAEIKAMSDAQWEKERLKVANRFPPKLRVEAIERAQLRVDDLNAMNEAQWEIEREKLLLRLPPK